MTRPILLACALLASVVSFNASAQSSSQTRMAECSAKNKGKTGDDYKTAQKACLSAKPVASPATPQERMKTCNASATGLKLTGDARKAFMSTCLKKA